MYADIVKKSLSKLEKIENLSYPEKIESVLNQLVNKRNQMYEYDLLLNNTFEFGNYVSSIILSLKTILLNLGIPEIEEYLEFLDEQSVIQFKELNIRKCKNFIINDEIKEKLDLCINCANRNKSIQPDILTQDLLELYFDSIFFEIFYTWRKDSKKYKQDIMDYSSIIPNFDLNWNIYNSKFILRKFDNQKIEIIKFLKNKYELYSKI